MASKKFLNKKHFIDVNFPINEIKFKLSKKIIALLISAVAVVIILGIVLGYFLVKNISNKNLVPHIIHPYTFKILTKYKHVHDPLVGKEIKIDPLSKSYSTKVHPFTQGFFFSDKTKLTESSGLYNSSFLREFDLTTGDTIRYTNIGNRYFAEGTTLIIEPSTYKKYILQLTFKEKRILVFDYESFELYHTFIWGLTGYGLTSNIDGHEKIHKLKDMNFAIHQKLWATTGDEYLYELKIPENFKEVKELVILKKTKIICEGFIIDRANELDYHLSSKTIYANIFLTSLIFEINIETGACVKIINLKGLIKNCHNHIYLNEDGDDVLNGVAISPRSRDKSTPTLYVTGKNWSNIFEIELIKKVDELAHKLLLKGKFKLNI